MNTEWQKVNFLMPPVPVSKGQQPSRQQQLGFRLGADGRRFIADTSAQFGDRGCGGLGILRIKKSP